MTYLAICLALYVAGLLFLPLTFWRGPGPGNAKNWPGVIVMRRGLECPGAVWAQEFYEARRRWRWLVLDPFLILIGRAWPKLGLYERAQELMGHEIEVIAELTLKKAGSYNPVRRREAEALSRYRVFDGYSPDEIERLMLARHGAAAEFVERHFGRIEEINQQAN